MICASCGRPVPARTTAAHGTANAISRGSRLAQRLAVVRGPRIDSVHYRDDSNGAAVPWGVVPSGLAPRGTMDCPRCQQSNPVDARFCESCGALLARRCSACGREVRAGAHFCAGCGAALEASSADEPTN